MAAIYRVLAQLAPSAAAQTTLYTCATSSVVISSLLVCNSDNSVADAVTVRINIGGVGDDPKQLVFAGLPVMPNGTVDLTAGLTLANGDVIKVTSANGTSSFNLFGQENS
jgi:hypothetical protein